MHAATPRLNWYPRRTIFSVHEVFRVHDFEIVFIFTLSIFFKKCENNESIISFNYKIHNLHKFFS